MRSSSIWLAIRSGRSTRSTRSARTAGNSSAKSTARMMMQSNRFHPEARYDSGLNASPSAMTLSSISHKKIPDARLSTNLMMEAIR